MKIVDIKEYLGEIRWADAAQHIDGAMIRGSVGYRLDDRFRENVRGCVENKVPIGVYWLSIATHARAAVKEAKTILEAVDKLRLSLPIVIQFDNYSLRSAQERGCRVTSDDVREIVLSACQTIREAGFRAMYATSLSVQTAHLSGIEEQFPLWLQAFCEPAKAAESGPQLPCAMWSYGTERIHGIGKNVAVSEVYTPMSEDPVEETQSGAELDDLTWAITNRITTDDRADHPITLGEAVALLRRYNIAFGLDPEEK